MVKMIDKEMLDAWLGEWSQVKEQSDFTLYDEEYERTIYIQILEGKTLSNCGLYWNQCKYVFNDNYSVYASGRISGGRFKETKYDFEFEFVDEDGEKGITIPTVIGKKIRPKLQALLKQYDRLNAP